MLKKKAYSIVFLLVAAVLATKIFLINYQWPAATLIEIPAKESFSVNGLSLCVTASSIVSPWELYEEYDIEKNEQEQLFIEQMRAQGWDAKILVVKLSVVNETNDKITFRAGSLMAECGPWSNGVDHELFLTANQSTGTVEMEAYQSKEIYLFYDLYDQHFTTAAWQNLASLPFSLTVALYPEKVLLCV